MAETRRQHDPEWWTNEHESAWERVKHHFQRWFADRSKSHDWSSAERAFRFGYGSRQRPAAADPDAWDEELEARLEQEWDTMHHPSDGTTPPRAWDDVRQFVYRGWMGP